MGSHSQERLGVFPLKKHSIKINFLVYPGLIVKHGQIHQSCSQGVVALLPLSKLPLCTDREQTPYREKPQVK